MLIGLAYLIVRREIVFSNGVWGLLFVKYIKRNWENKNNQTEQIIISKTKQKTINWLCIRKLNQLNYLSSIIGKYLELGQTAREQNI